MMLFRRRGTDLVGGQSKADDVVRGGRNSMDGVYKRAFVFMISQRGIAYTHDNSNLPRKAAENTNTSTSPVHVQHTSM